MNIGNAVSRRLNEAFLQAERSGYFANIQAYNRAKLWMTNLAAGDARDIRSLLFVKSDKKGGKAGERESYEDILFHFDAIVKASSASNDMPSFIGEALLEAERSQREKVGPKSPSLPWQKDGPSKVDEIYSDKPLVIRDRNAYKRARERLRELVPSSVKLYAQTIEDALASEAKSSDVDNLSNGNALDTSTNSGPPWWKRGIKPNQQTDSVADYQLKSAIYKWYVQDAHQALDTLKRGKIVHWKAAAAQRLTSRGLKPYDPKSKRLVIAIGKTEAIVGKTWTPSVQNYLKNIRMLDADIMTFMAWNDTPVIDYECQKLLKYAKSSNEIVVSGDLSSFDQTFSPQLIVDVGETIAPWVQGYEKVIPAMAESMAYHVSLLTPTKFYREQPSSMKSGSILTNLFDCLGNLLAQFYGEELGLYKLTGTSVQGDDFIVLGQGVNPESTEAAYKELGFEANKSKQYYRPNSLSYLQRLHFLDYLGGMASVYRVLGSCLVYERMRYKSKDYNPYMEAIQTIAKLENAAFNPYFTDLVNFVKSGDKFQLGADLPATEVISKAGKLADDVIQRGKEQTVNFGTMQADVTGFERSATNGVLRGKVVPPIGTRERFLFVYGKERVNKAADSQ
jgi:hypothetical protein